MTDYPNTRFFSGSNPEGFTTEDTEATGGNAGFQIPSVFPCVLCGEAFDFIFRTAPSPASLRRREFRRWEFAGGRGHCPLRRAEGQHLGRLLLRRGTSCPRTRELRCRLALRRELPCRWWASAVGFRNPPSTAEIDSRPPPGRWLLALAWPLGLHSRRCRQSRAKAPAPHLSVSRRP